MAPGFGLNFGLMGNDRFNMKIPRRTLVLGGLAVTLPAVYLAVQPVRTPAVDMVLLDGTRLNQTFFDNRVTLVNFWATSCTVCVAEMPALADLYREYQGRGFSLVAVAMQRDAPSNVVHFSQSRSLPFPVAIDNTGAVARAWGDVALTPTSFLVNQQGRVVKRFQGAPDFSELRALIAKTLVSG